MTSFRIANEILQISRYFERYDQRNRRVAQIPQCTIPIFPLLLNGREAGPSRSRLMCKYSYHSHSMAKPRRPWSFKCRPHIYEDFVARSRCLQQGWMIASRRILRDAITYPCPRYLLLATKSKYKGSDIPNNKDPRIDVDWISIRRESIDRYPIDVDPGSLQSGMDHRCSSRCPCT